MISRRTFIGGCVAAGAGAAMPTIEAVEQGQVHGYAIAPGQIECCCMDDPTAFTITIGEGNDAVTYRECIVSRSMIRTGRIVE